MSRSVAKVLMLKLLYKQVGQLSQTNRAAAWVSFGKKYKCEKRASNIALYPAAFCNAEPLCRNPCV